MLIENFLLVYLVYFLIIFSSIGYGKILVHYCLKKDLNYGYYGLFGLFFLIIYSYISNFFYQHSLFHNILILIVGLFSYAFIKKTKSKVINCVTIFSLLFVSIIIFKTHDDFPYYHFPYTYYLTQTKLMVGVGNFNHGFRTPSSIFYLNSLYYLPYLKFFFFHMGATLIMGFVNIILFEKLTKFKFKKIDFIFFFVLSSLLFINIFFYRISEHGTDRSAQILIFLLIVEILILLNQKKLDPIIASIVLLLTGLIISLKAFYILYLSYFFVLFYFFLKRFSFRNILVFIKSLKVFYLFLTLLFLVLFTNLMNTGCLLYPVYFTCFDSLSWSLPLNEVIRMNNWYELWSKGGAAPNFRVDNPETYIEKFNWINNWIEIYFFNKVSDFLIGLLVLSFILIVLFYSKKRKSFKIKKELILLYCLTLILFFEWLYNHPALRYGGYILICILVFFLLSSFLMSFSQKKERIILNIKILLFLGLFVFLTRNIDRIGNEVEKYNFKPLLDLSFRVSDHHYRIQNQINGLISNHILCKNNLKKCDEENAFKVNKKYGTYIFSR